MTLTHLQQEAREDFRKEEKAYFDTVGTHMTASEISMWWCERLAKAYTAGQDSIVDYIEAECEWVKEDVADGNYGYFRADKKLLESARTASDTCTCGNPEMYGVHRQYEKCTLLPPASEPPHDV